MDLPAPMLPTAGRLPVGPAWVYEMKWDGIRAVAGSRGGDWQVATRTGRDATPQFPELASLTGLGDIIVDGELTVFDGDRLDWGATITRLRSRPSRALTERYPVTVLVFDVLRWEGEDLRARPWAERRAVLEGLDLPDGWVRTPVFADGEATMAVSQARGLEGAVAKRRASGYRPGRSRDWIKQRHRNLVDAVVIGWALRSQTEVTLLLAEHTPGGLAYIGRCRAPRALADALAPLATRSPAVEVAAARDIRWVRPELEVEVAAASRHPDGRLRQPRFVRARVDQLG